MNMKSKNLKYFKKAILRLRKNILNKPKIRSVKRIIIQKRKKFTMKLCPTQVTSRK